MHRLLRKHTAISGFEHVHKFEDEGQHLQTVFDAALKYGGPGKFAFHPQAYLNETSSLITEENRHTLLQEWGRHWDFSKPFLIEKSPPNLIRMRFLQAMFPQSKFIIIVRHPLAAGYATQKWSKTSIRELVEHWCIAHQIMFEDIKHLKNYIMLRYEDFVEQPDMTMKILSDWIGIQAEPLAEAVEKDVNKKYFAMWEKEINADPMLLRRVRLYNPMLHKLGYYLKPPYTRTSHYPVIGGNDA